MPVRTEHALVDASAPPMAAGRGSADPIRVTVIDTRRLIADALASLVERIDSFAVLGAAGPEEAVAAIERDRPDLVIFGVSCDATEALRLLRDLRNRAPGTEIVIVADSLEPELVRFVVEEGIAGLILSDVPATEITSCIDQISKGHSVLPAGWHDALASHDLDPTELLSKRQLEVLRLLAEGCSYEEIATRLFISVNTVKFHTRSIFSRLGVRNRMAAARLLGKRE